MLRILYPIIIIMFAVPIFSKIGTVTLEQCIKIALENHPDLFAADEDSKNSIFQYKIAKAGSGIQVSGSLHTVERLKAGAADLGDVRIPGKDTDIGLFAGFSASYILFDPQRFYREESAKMNINLQKLNELKLKSRIINDVNESFFNYIIAKQNVALYQKIYEQKTLEKKQADIQFSSGAISIISYNSTQFHFEDSKINLERVKNQESNARINLFTSMGIKGSEDLEVDYSEPDKLPIIKFNIHDLNSLALIFNLSIREARINKDVARLNIISKKGLNKPVVSLIFSLGYENMKIYGIDQAGDNFTNENWTPTFFGFVTASLPLYTGGGNAAQEDSAYSNYNKAQYHERNIVRMINNSILSIYTNINDLNKQVVMSKQLIDLSRKQYKMIKTNFESGLSSQVDLFNQEISILRSEINYINNIYSYLKQLNALSGLVGVSGEYLWQK